MRLVIVSDTHEQHAKFVVPDGDVFVHCGDLTYRGDMKAIAAAGAWIAALPHRHKLVIAGNHDWAFERSPRSAREALRGESNIVYLQDSGVTLEGIAFYGSPWQPRFYDWAFNLNRGEALAQRWALIPDATDVILTHGPPAGVLDLVDGDHVGCADLLRRVEVVKPRVHAFGHIHEGSGVTTKYGTTFVNASICNEKYKPVNPARIVDL